MVVPIPGPKSPSSSLVLRFAALGLALSVGWLVVTTARRQHPDPG
jgi:hypothetical protein